MGLIICDDCLDAMKGMPDNYVDSIVTDPPYGIAFMGKGWDHGVPGKEYWEEALRIAKPGAHLLAFGGTRTYHRLVCAIDDAGWEIRDMIEWMYGSGFPKSSRINIDPMFCQCAVSGHNAESNNHEPQQEDRICKEPESDDGALPSSGVLRSKNKVLDSQGGCLRDSDLRGESAPVFSKDGQVLSPLPKCVPKRNRSYAHGGDQASLPLHIPSQVQCNDHLSSPGCSNPLRSSNATSKSNRKNKLLFDTSVSDRHILDTRQDFSYSKNIFGGSLCQVCKKPKADGFGTALKPAHESIVLARKPISEKTIAKNVLKWGTGGINIDGCRVGSDGGTKMDGELIKGKSLYGGGLASGKFVDISKGRFPANLIHDGSDEVKECFPDSISTISKNLSNNPIGFNPTKNGLYGTSDKCFERKGHSDSGSAMRFFYCAKASSTDRNEGCEDLIQRRPDERDDVGMGTFVEKGVAKQHNHHPTVKPTSLMRYLCKLITPPGGTVLDPFAGSGSTGKAAKLEGFDFILIDKEKEYCEIAERRTNQGD